MTEEQIVKKVCEIMGVKYSHYDNHRMGLDYFPHQELQSIPKIVCYGSSFGRWQFAILEDMTIINDMTPFNKSILEMVDSIEANDIEIDTTSHIKPLKEEMTKIKLAEHFLKENKCDKVINNPNKKINWV